MSAPILALDGLSVAYGKVEAVRGVSLAMQPGSIVTVIGANGAGKTTLLNAVMGMLPAAGRVAFDGAALDGLRIEERVGDGPRAGAGAARAVRLHERSRTISALGGFRTTRRASAPQSLGAGVRALPAPAGASHASSPARCRAASGRCWPWAAP